MIDSQAVAGTRPTDGRPDSPVKAPEGSAISTGVLKRLAIVGLLLAGGALSGCRLFCPESRYPAYCCPTAQPARVQAAPVCNPPAVCVPCQ